MGALSGAVTKVKGAVTQKIMRTKGVQSLISKMNGGGKFSQFIAGKMSNIATGKSSQWSTISKHLKNQHELIGSSRALKKKLFSLMLSALPTYLAQTVWAKGKSKVMPSAWDRIKKWVTKEAKEWWKKFLGISDGETECAAAC